MARRDGYVLSPVAAFNGLNLRQQPRVGALDLRNVIFADVGGVLTRPGSARFGSVDHGAAVKALGRFRSVGGSRRLLVSLAASVRALDENGALAQTAAGAAIPTAAMTSFARVGAPGSERVYMGNGVDTVRRYDLVGGFSAPTARILNGVTGAITTARAMPRALCVANWAQEARTVYGGFDSVTGGPDGAASDHDSVWISEPGDPEFFRDSSRISVSPGDGARTRAIVSWRDSTFVFKEDKHFVLSGVSVDASGVPTFLRRGVDSGVGPVGPYAAAAGRDGVYFVGRKGLYFTTGTEPVLLSGNLDALWGEAPLPAFYTGGRIKASALKDIALSVVGDYVYMAFASEFGSGQDRVLVYHARQHWFSLYELPVTCMATFENGSIEQLHFARPNVNVAMRHGEQLIGDDGGPYPSWWFGGYDELAGGRVVRVRQQAIYGAGKLDVGLAPDFEALGDTDRVDLASGTDTWGDGTDPTDVWGDGTIPTDTWGAGAALKGRLVRRAEMCAFAALYLGDRPATLADQQQWLVHRATKHIAGGRAVSVITGRES